MKLITIAVVLTIITSSASDADTNLLSQSAPLRDGFKLFGERNFDAALPLLKRAMDENKENKKLMTMLLSYYIGECYLQAVSNNTTEARKWFESGLITPFNSEEILYRLCQIVSTQTEKEAHQKYEEQLKIIPLRRETDYKNPPPEVHPPQGMHLAGSSPHYPIDDVERAIKSDSFDRAIVFGEHQLSKYYPIPGRLVISASRSKDPRASYSQWSEPLLYKYLAQAYELLSKELNKNGRTTEAKSLEMYSLNYAIREYIVRTWFAPPKQKNVPISDVK